LSKIALLNIDLIATYSNFEMKGAIFNFLVLQVVIWAFVFSTNEKTSEQYVKHASISDTWKVSKVAEDKINEVVLHYPSFNKLTLNLDGTYIRLRNNETLEEGNWKIDDEKLTLINKTEIQRFDIIQLPSINSETFVIKENLRDSKSNRNIKYELTRI